MSIEIVGRENLPNLYIKEISVDQQGSNGIIISVLVYLKDVKSNGRFQWYDNEPLRKNMKLMIVGSNSVSFNNGIRSGQHNGAFTPDHLKRITGYDRDQVQYKFLSVMNLSKECLKQEPEESSDGDLYTFVYRCKFHVANFNNFSVFGACVLDVKQFAVESNVDLSNNTINAFHGPVVGEEVFRQGDLVETSNLLFKPDGELYTGPVHMHNNGYMVGSKHSSMPHSNLTVTQIPNIKVKDYRIQYKKKPIGNKLQKSPMFSDLYTSYDNNGSLKGSFHVNVKQFFVQNTQYGGLLLQLNQELFDTMLSKVRFKEVSIVREAVIPRKIIKKSGTTQTVARRVLRSVEVIKSYDRTPYRLRNRYKYFDSRFGRSKMTFGRTRSRQGRIKLQGSIHEVHESDSLSLRAFTFSDLSISQKFGGFYRYKVSVDIQDPTSDYVMDILKELRSGVTQFGAYKSALEKRYNYDYVLNRTKEEFTERMAQSNTWINATNIYLKYYDLLFEANEQEMERLTNQIVSLVNPRTATVKSVNRFLAHYQFIFNYMMKYFGKSDKIFNEANTRGSVKTSNPDLGKIKFLHTWPQLHNFRRNKCRMTFLPEGKLFKSRPELFPTLYRGEFLKMVSDEKKKYFKSQPAFTKDTIPFLKPEHIIALNNTEQGSHTYFSPNRLFLEERVFDVSRIETIDLYEFNEFFSHFVGRGSEYADKVNTIQRSNDRRAREVMNRARSSFYIKKPKASDKDEPVERKESNVSQKLGKDSTMSTSQKSDTKIGNNILESKTKNIFNSFESNKASRGNRSRDSFILDGKESILTALYKEKNFDLARLVWIPQQIKSLFASNYSFGTSNLLKSNYDLLLNPFTRDYVNLLFFTIGRIEYLSGYGLKSDGSEDIRNPIWQVMTPEAYRNNNRILLCRIKLYTDAALKMQELDYESFNIQDQYFYINGKTQADEMPEDSPLMINRKEDVRGILTRQQVASLHPIEFSKSILISQKNNKNGPLTNVDYGVQEAQLQDNNDFNQPVQSTPTTSRPTMPTSTGGMRGGGY